MASLATFIIVAEERSFTKAAKRQGVSPSAISHAMRGLEEELGVRLLARTTRSVSLTDAGERLLVRLKPALGEIGETLEELSGNRNKPAGRIRLLLPRLAVKTVLAPKLAQLHREYPDIVLDVTTDDSRRDIVAGRLRCGRPLRRIHREGHDRHARVARSAACHHWFSCVLRIPSEAEAAS